MKRCTSPGWATYGRGRAHRWLAICAMPSARLAENPAATTPWRALREPSLPWARKSAPSRTMKSTGAWSVTKRSGSSKSASWRLA